jgi:glycosyltransferase involved in cell wall biosynthesis
MRKVNFLIGTLTNGGAERVISNLTLNLNNTKANIVLFGKYSKIDYPYLGHIIFLDRSMQVNTLVKILTLIKRIYTMRKIKQMDKEATTISLLEYPNLLNAATYSRGRTIISVRNHMSTKYQDGIKSRLWKLTIKYLYPKADLIISVSEEIKRDLIINYKIDANKIKVIYNSYDIDSILHSSQEAINDEFRSIFDNQVIITAGRLNMQKGHWHLIRAFSVVKQEVPNAKLVILGEGNLEHYLKQLACDLNIANDVYFLGFQLNPFKYIVKSRIFVMTSLYEGFPNALAEAMACGVPVISSDCKSGPREILAPGELEMLNIDYEINEGRYGVLVPVCDGKMYNAFDAITEEELALSKSIISLLREKELWNHFSNQSRKRIQDFEIKKLIKEWESVI